MKRIALDLDGVVFDSENLYRVYTEIYDTDNKGNTIIDNSQRIFQKRYDWNKEEFENFYRENSQKILETANIMPGADIVINKLKDKFEFIVVTARNEFETKIAIKKLTVLGIKNIKVYSNEHNKIDRLVKEKIDYIIDDDDVICINAAKNGICAIYLKNNASNKLEETSYIKNVHNWGEIYKYLILNNKIN